MRSATLYVGASCGVVPCRQASEVGGCHSRYMRHYLCTLTLRFNSHPQWACRQPVAITAMELGVGWLVWRLCVRELPSPLRKRNVQTCFSSDGKCWSYSSSSRHCCFHCHRLSVEPRMSEVYCPSDHGCDVCDYQAVRALCPPLFVHIFHRCSLRRM